MQDTPASIGRRLHSAHRYVEDVDVGAHSVSGWALQYDQLSAGRYAGEIREVRFLDVQAFHESMNRMVHHRGRFPGDAMVFGIATHATGDCYFEGERVKPGSLMLCPSGGPIDFRTPLSMELLSVSIDARRVRDVFARIGIDLARYERRPALRLCEPGPKVDAIHAILKEIFWLSGHAADRLGFGAVQRELEDRLLLAFADLLPETGEAGGDATLGARRQLVRKACEHVLDNLGDSPSILDLCARLGTSRRKLNYCFQEVLGVSPVQYLRALRLNGARRDLKQPGRLTRSVQDISGKWGFWHQGQFGQYYRAMFGEAPSETLRHGAGA
ncbi:helix-turn-helix domain-containing protein [Massilia cellulosiltytica]|uniref:helix-turn-helix domain-containing protein n=1 Tax=Massilia cellulosiltytica TaxID=2683234 RepID=UPI0039B62018